jgi:ring-1,2-phenylacetyl-CoA epoxidase subunit PaaB
MENISSLDPRVERLGGVGQQQLDTDADTHWVTWEIFHQEKKGKQVIHVGVVHAPSAEMALVFAKETFGRRGKTTNLWAVKTSDVFTFRPEEEEIFDTTSEKVHREPGFYKVRDRIEAFRTKNNLV